MVSTRRSPNPPPDEEEAAILALQEERKQAALLSRADIDRLAPVDHLERPEDAIFQSPSCRNALVNHPTTTEAG